LTKDELGDVPEKSTVDAWRWRPAADTSRKRRIKDPRLSEVKTKRCGYRSARLNNRNIIQADKTRVEGEATMNFWRRLRDALSPKGTPVFLVAIIAFLLAMLVSIYVRYWGVGNFLPSSELRSDHQWLVLVPDLTSVSGIKLNARVSLRGAGARLSSAASRVG
jgi:hypothetical protein